MGKDKNKKYKINEDIKNKIETMLYAYPSLLEYIEDNNEIIKELREGGLQQKSKDIIINEGHGSSQNVCEFDKLENAEAQAFRTWIQVDKIRKVLDRVKKQDIEKYSTDIYYQIIEQHYFRDISFEKVAYNTQSTTMTVMRHSERLMYQIALKLYGIDVIEGIV